MTRREPHLVRARAVRRRARVVELGVTLAAALGALLGTSGCRDPWADVRAGLSPAERARFDSGARIAAPCAACHDLAGDALKIGPPLSGLDGRPAGSVPGFGYSSALLRSGLVWNARTLDAFLAAPQRVVPGNRMVSPGVAGSAARGDLVYFLIQAGGRFEGGSSRGPAS